MLSLRRGALLLGSTSRRSITTQHLQEQNTRINRPLKLDPSLQELLTDVSMSLNKSSYRKPPPPEPHRELESEAVETTDELTVVEELEYDPHVEDIQDARKSPAALFGSTQIGSLVIPLEMRKSISLMIDDADKTQLHQDALRLFKPEEQVKGKKSPQDAWGSDYDNKMYRSKQQAARHAERDGTAFASVALPAHYAAIYAVMDHAKRRLGNALKVDRVVDWGSGTGSGLWATMHSFQNPGVASEDPDELPELKLANSTIVTYLSIDKREGLTTIARRLLKGLDLGGMSPQWRKEFREEDQVKRTQGASTLALSAFQLTACPTPVARKALVKEMWESGAHTIVLIDHNTTAGFECVAEARAYLLKMGSKEFEDPETEDWPLRGSHVVAPCPHDGACPLHHPGGSTRLLCGFTQRLQRPDFVRKTKHSGVGHEDVEYSYVVLRRGPRPRAPVGTGWNREEPSTLGRVGDVGKRVTENDDEPELRELILHEEHERRMAAGTANPETNEELEISVIGDNVDAAARLELLEALRVESYDWPRLVFTPIKKSGHILLDACTSEGKIMRLTIPKSQGKQPFYDARKSSWGDIFPHEPKNAPQVRTQPDRKKRQNGTTATKGQDIGKRKKTNNPASSYSELAKDVIKTRKDVRAQRGHRSRENVRDMYGTSRDDLEDER